MNFFGNQTIWHDDAISISRSWVPNNSITKGRRARTCAPFRRRVGRSTAYSVAGTPWQPRDRGEIVPYRVDGLELGIHGWFRDHGFPATTPDSWGAVGCWAWGLSRVMDYLCLDQDVDAGKIALIGHSRLGKVALWAGAQDERFAMVIANNSGCGGAALASRKFGERVADVNAANPHWFCHNFRQFDNREDALPMDQHELIALVAPRPVYVGSAQLDSPADPMGEFLAARHASPVYEFLGCTGLPGAALPSVDVPLMGTVGYHLRKGRHALTSFDWNAVHGVCGSASPPHRNRLRRPHC